MNDSGVPVSCRAAGGRGYVSRPWAAGSVFSVDWKYWEASDMVGQGLGCNVDLLGCRTKVRL